MNASPTRDGIAFTSRRARIPFRTGPRRSAGSGAACPISWSGIPWEKLENFTIHARSSSRPGGAEARRGPGIAASDFQHFLAVRLTDPLATKGRWERRAVRPSRRPARQIELRDLLDGERRRRDAAREKRPAE